MSTILQQNSFKAVADLLPDSWIGMHKPAPIAAGDGKRCVFYSRYSSEGQKETSIERQVEGCEAYARLNGLKPLASRHLFVDRGKSGYYLDGRDDLAALRRLASEGGRGFDQLVCESLDRLSRNVADVLRIYEDFKALGIEIHVTSGGVGKVDDVDAVFYGFIGMEQRERMLRLMSQGAWRAALRGSHVGSIPYGFRRGAAVGELVVVEEEVRIVDRIYRLFDSGVDAVRIARLLNSERIPSPSGRAQWTRSQIIGAAGTGSGILRNPKYVGVYIYGKRKRVRRPGSSSKTVQLRPSTSWVYGAKPDWCVIDRSLWLRVLCRLKRSNDEKTVRKTRERHSKATLLFHGRYRCACGAPIVAAFKSVSTTRNLFCYSHIEGGTCDRSGVLSSTYVECEILREIRDHILTSVDLPAYVREYDIQLRRIGEEVARETKERLRRIAELDDWLERSIDSAINRGGADEDMERARSRKRAERSDHRLALAALPDIASMPRVDPEAFVSLRDEVNELIRRMPIAATTEGELLLVQSLRGLVEKVVIDRSEEDRGYTLEITFAPSSLVAWRGPVDVAGLGSITIRRVCPPPTTNPANLAEMDEALRSKAATNEHALTDQDWEIVADLVHDRPFDDGRWVMDAALFYLRNKRGLQSLPPPYSNRLVHTRVRRFVLNGYWRLAYAALVEADSPAVRDLDTSRFAAMERIARDRLAVVP